MERVAFLVEATGARITCQLNPESFVIRRSAGAQPRRSLTGQISGAGVTDDPLLLTGGGRTELEFELLFDVSLVEASQAVENVRDLTQPLWNLAENVPTSSGYRQLPTARFIWGKTWNIPGVVVAIAERLEQFTPAGAAQRSWLHIKFVRVNEPKSQKVNISSDASSHIATLFTPTALDRGRPSPTGEEPRHEVIGATGQSGQIERVPSPAEAQIISAAPVAEAQSALAAQTDLAIPSSPADRQPGDAADGGAMSATEGASSGEGSTEKDAGAAAQKSSGAADEAPGLLSRLRRRRKSAALPSPANRTSGAVGAELPATGDEPTKSSASGAVSQPEEMAQPLQAAGQRQEANPPMGQRLDEIAARYYGDPALWRLIAYYNRLDDPLHLLPGTALQIPPLSILGGTV